MAMMETNLGESMMEKENFVKDAEQAVRLGFVRKVYGIVAAQLLLTILIAALFQTASKTWLLQNNWLLMASSSMTLVTICAMMCCQNLTNKYPSNYILLFVFTACEGVMVGFISAQYTWQTVILAMSMTLLVFIGLTVYAWNTKTDFTGMGPYFMVALMALCGFGIVLCIFASFGVNFKLATLGMDLAGVLIFSLYLVYDTQLILGCYGGHKVSFGVDDYVFAALNLYLDIIQLFIYIMQALGD